MTTCKKEWVLLCCLMVAAACQREPMGEIDPEVREVNTQFVFNIATSAAQTKQASDAVQEGANPVFRGISDAKLMSYTLSEDGEILKQDAAPSKVYDLSQLVAAGSGPRRVLEMSLPIQTNTLLLYGRAPVRTDVTGGFSAKDYYGYLDDYTVSNVVGSGNFQLGKRLQNETGFFAMEKLIAGVLTVIMNTSMTDDTGRDDINTDGFTVKKSDYPNLWWSMYYKSDANTDTGKSPVETDKDRYPLEEKLGHLYKEMTSIHYNTSTQETELRAGSGTATLRIVTDLWSVINSVRCATPLSKAEAVAKVFAERVHIHIQKYFTGSVSSTGGPVTDVAFKSISDIGANLLGGSINGEPVSADLYWPNNETAKSYKPTTKELAGITAESPADFPANFDIMRGAAYMAFDATHYFFYYPKYFNTSATGGIPDGDVENGFSAGSYYYPAELLYFGNSPLRTSDLEHKVNEYPETVADWNKDTKWAAKTDGKDDWKGAHVYSTTHSVAMKYPIRYGVSMLETKVGYKDDVRPGGTGATGYLLDNNHAVQKRVVEAQGGTLGDNEEPDKQIAIKDGSFKLVGVVVGGQPQNVGWDFLPRTEPNTNKKVTGFIYDKAVTNQVIPAGDGSTFTPNYTVVFDNYSESGYTNRTEGNYGQDKVYVALEFQNCTGEDFYGNFNLIRNEGYFYLIGELDPAGKSVVWPTDGNVIPPYKYEGGSYIGIPRVFIQDYKTSVTFKFGLNSLKYAYLTVPDLRASSLTMGLSVDIEWKQGLEYDEVVIGGN